METPAIDVVGQVAVKGVRRVPEDSTTTFTALPGATVDLSRERNGETVGALLTALLADRRTLDPS